MTTAIRPLRGTEHHIPHHREQIGQRLSRIGAYLLACLAVAGQRRRLLALDDHMLKDIGISRADAHAEARRSFWDIPEEQMPGE